MVDIDLLVPNPRNPNKHPDNQIKLLAKIMAHQGWRSPIVVSNRSGFITKGHGRLMAAKLNGWTQAPVDKQDYANEADEFADMVADNKIAELSETDMTMVNEDALTFPDLDMDLLGIPDFEPIEINQLEPQCDEDELPEHVEPKTKLGDIYKLGNHRLMCGDSTMIDQVEKLMDGNTCVLMVTDPPYGVKLDQSWRDEALGDKALGKGNKALVKNDDRADWYDVWAIAPTNIAYIWHASSFTDVVMDSMRRAGFDVRQQIIWNKSVMVMGRSAYHFKHEPCWYGVKKGCDANWQGDRKQTTVWDAAPPNHIMGGSKEDKTGHPTQKPVIVYDIPIMNHTKQGDGLYEPFGGSGTAIIACEKSNRKAFVMELSPNFCDIIVARWEKYTGKKAELING